ncbi:MAG: thiamine-phosphate kinase [Acidobacteria bacterium]|nr:MAG: thiamine-phosphate kinase [Acidobacteriota bacterium]
MRRGPLSSPGNQTVADAGERAIIAAIRRRLPAAPAWLAVGIGDDAAVVQPERGALEILTTDASIEGVHFNRRFSAPCDIGWKALAVNVSDVAAMGGAPRLALLSLALPADFPVADLDALLDGFIDMAREARVTLAGGNIARSPGPLMIDVTVTGTARPRRVLTRGGGRPGDALYVSGAVGAALAGLEWLRRSDRSPEVAASNTRLPEDAGLAECVRRYRRPTPRSRLGALLGRNRAANACMDLSDGLADAVDQMADASGTGAAIDAQTLPIPAAARRLFEDMGRDSIAAAVMGGDDYELLIAVPKRARGRFATVQRQTRGIPLTRIGELTLGPGTRLLRDGNVEPLPAGFVHF